MSSRYLILCVSHDPAIVVGDSWRDPGLALVAVADRTGSSPAAGHPNCHLLVGRYSYPLIEVCCPRTTTVVHSGFHPHEDHWVDAGWLRLLALATPEQRKAAQRTGCWQWETAWRLRDELGIGGQSG